MPHLDTRLCMLLCIMPLVVSSLVEEEERIPTGDTENGHADQWNEQVLGKCRKDLVLSLQSLGDHQSLLVPPQSVAAAANQAAAKAMLVASGITIGSASFECFNLTETPIDCCK